MVRYSWSDDNYAPGRAIFFLNKLGNDASAAKTSGNMHFDDRSGYISFEESIFLIIISVDLFVKSDQKTENFHGNSMYRHVRDLLEELRNLQLV